MKLVKTCPECGAKQTYTWSSSFKKAKKNNTICRYCSNRFQARTYKHWATGKFGKNNPSWRDPVDRFWPKVDIKSETECWNWTGARSPLGYGRFSVDRNESVWVASRYSWFIHNGPIPKGMYICHKCDNPPCVNPNHLFLGTQSDNIKDAYRKGRHAWSK